MLQPSSCTTLIWSRLSYAAVAFIIYPVAGYALVFNFNPAPGTSAAAVAAMQVAGARWSSHLTDNVSVNVNFAFAPQVSTLATNSSATGTISYGAFRNALIQDRTSALDNAAVASLPLTSVAMMINRTSDSPNGSGSALPFLDSDGSANNATIRATFANFKAVGLLPANNPAADASISINSNLMWDFDVSDGLTPGFRDFVGVATHEIGHALGFRSGVDVLDTSALADSNTFRISPLDLFRFSELSTANNAIDWTADTRTKYFSTDRGLTIGPMFATGDIFGDGEQAGHWKDNLGLGIMDPTARITEIPTIFENDLRAMDVIGWNRTAIPDNASTIGLLGVALALMGAIRLRAVKVASGKWTARS